MSDLRQSPNYAKYMKSLGWEVDKISNFYIYSKRLPIIGTFIKIQRPNSIKSSDLHKILKLSKNKNTFQIFIEPKTKGQEKILKQFNFKASKQTYLPSKTLRINLKQDLKTILKNMHYKTRYNIVKNTKRNFDIGRLKNVDNFSEFWHNNFHSRAVRIINMKSQIKNIYKAFGKDARIIVVKNRKEILSGILLLTYQNISYYMYAASSSKGRKTYAPTVCVWEAIKYSKEIGSDKFDFEGIYDNRFPINSWKGFSRFKKSFGGKEITYPGSYFKYQFPYLI